MTFNYSNLGSHALENMLPLFGNLTNGGASAITNHPNFINQLAAAITTAAAVGAVSGPPSMTSITSTQQKNNQREKTPEAPPAPKLSTSSPPRLKPNQGTAPMDLENESEQAILSVTTTSNNTATTKTTEKFSMQNTNLYLNGLMSTPGYMFFPTATTTTSSATANANSMLIDPAAMMAAAMQQVQQNYAGYAITPTPDTTVLDVNTASTANASDALNAAASGMKDIVKTKSCILFPPNPNAPPPTIRERPPGCRTVFVGGLPENITEEIIREIFEPCGEITTLRMSKKNFCHIRYRQEASIDRAIYLSGYRVRISNLTEPANFGRLHVDYAQARDDQYDYECRQRQLQREQRHKERLSLDRMRSQSPPPMAHYTDHEASLVSEHLRNNDTFLKAIQTISVWLERGDCTKRNANIFYTMIQITHGHVRRLHTDKQQLESDLQKTRENFRKQMLTMSSQFTQIEKVFNAASHKKVWDHFSKAQRKNIDQWKKLASELRSVQIEDDEMEMSDDDRDYHSRSSKRIRHDSENLKEENDSLRCQLEAIRNEMSLERTDIKHDSDFREKQIKVLQETIRNMQTQLLQTKLQEQRDAKTIEQLERKLKEAGVKQLLLKTKIKETNAKLKDKESLTNVVTGDAIKKANEEQINSDNLQQFYDENVFVIENDGKANEIIDIDVYKSDDDVRIIEDQLDVIEVQELDAKNENKINLEKTATATATIETNKTKLAIATKENFKNNNVFTEKLNVNNKDLKSVETTDSKNETISSLPTCDAKIVALATAYLVIHPFGASSDSICIYLRSIQKSINLESAEIERILKRYISLFKAESVPSETNNTINWKFCGFSNENTENV